MVAPLDDSLFERMVNEALELVGREGWQNASQNAVTLAAFGLLSHKIENLVAHRIDRLVKPAWFVGASIASGVVWLIVSKIFYLD